MSSEPRTRGRWLAAALVILGAAALALLLGPEAESPLSADGPAVRLGDVPVDDAEVRDGPAARAEGMERSYELLPGESFSLAVDRGDIEVLPAEGTTATLRVELVGGTRPPARFEWTSERGESGTSVRIRSQDSRGWLSRFFGSDEPDDGVVMIEGEPVKASGKRARVGRVVLELPTASPLRVSSGAGDLQVRDRSAEVVADSGAGDVVLTRIAADVDVDTGAGSVTLDAIAGAATVDSGAGDVEAHGVLGALDVDTGAGSVAFTGAPASVTVDTGAGGIEGELAALSGRVRLSTGMGGIRLHLPAGANAELVADSGLGSVEARIEGTRLGARRDRELRATLGEGGPEIRLSTGTGSIRVDDRAGANRSN